MVSVILLALAIAQQSPALGSTKVFVGKSQYRVEVRDDNRVRVHPKSIVQYPSERRLDDMHEAVRMVTGCEMIRPVYMSNTVRGTLDCSKASEPSP